MLFRDDMKAIADRVRAKVFDACREPADVIVSTDPAHVGYLSGYRSVLLDADRTYRCAVVATRDRIILVTGASDAAPALEVMRDPSCIYRYGTFYFSARDDATAELSAMPKAQGTFIEALREAVHATVRPRHMVGVDCAAESEVGPLKELVSETTFDARPAIIKARSVKLPEEIAKMRRAAEVTEKGMAEAFDHARPGATELELSAIISAEIIAGGGIPRFVVVTAGERSALADAYATQARLSQGDLLRLDIGCTLDGYWADTARTAVVGEPTGEQQERYDALLAGELAELALARPGVTAGDIFNVAVDGVRQRGFDGYRRSHCGHGLGIAPHEFPTLNPANQHVQIEEGMVLCVETPYYELGWGGMMVEDIIVICEGGNERLTNLPSALRRL
jgi:Xaa-Pro dipeptidase